MEASDRACLFWGGAVGGLILADVAVHKKFPEDPYTLSWQIRLRGQVDHPLGEAALVLGWLGFTSWFLPHIIKPARLARKAREIAKTIS